MIAVDENAKERLEKLSELHKVKAVDISTLQDLGNNNVNGAGDHCDSGSVGDQSCLSGVPEDCCSNGRDAERILKHPNTSELTGDTIQTHPNTSNDTILKHLNTSKLTGELSQSECCTELPPVRSADTDYQDPVSPKHSSVHSSRQASNTPSPTHLCDTDVQNTTGNHGDKHAITATETAPTVNGYQDNSYMLGTSAYGDGRMKYPLPGLTGSHDNMYSSHHSDLDMDVEVESGSHREMAIDCPPNFVGTKKETPRYPRSYANPNYSGRRLGGPEEYSGPEDSYTPPTGDQAPDPEQYDRIRVYQEDLRRRREEEDRIEREQEFLRTSLRGSKKLQALESRAEGHPPTGPPPSGIINPNYVEEEETSSSRAATLPVRQHRGTDALAARPIGKEVLLTQLAHFKKLRSVEDQKDLSFLHTLFNNPRFHHAMSTYNKVAEASLHNAKPPATDANSSELTAQILNLLPTHPPNTFVQELRVLLQTPHIRGVLRCHDDVVRQTPDNVTTATEEDEREYLYERASQYGDEIKIVRLQKTADPLGATVRNDGERVLIGRIVKGGAAEKSGLLHEGDEILEINGNDIRGKSVNDVCDLMASLTGTLTFLIIPSLDQRPAVSTDVVMHIRAHFNYDPEDDLYIPCRELGISFEKGDVLHVLNQEDDNWWQAYREGEEDQSLAGLIPSKTFQETKETMKQTIVADKNEDAKKRQRCRCTRKSGKKKQKKQLYNASGEELDAEEILTYEEVALYYPQPNRKRPVVLIGPPNVGRQELRQRLMESDEDRFAAAIPHTSRPKKDLETDGNDYHFVPRTVFEQDITDHKFVEYGEYEKNLYGTSLEAIREVVNSGKICVLNLYPQSLRVLKASDLKPYVVFIAPPNIEKLKGLRQKQGVKVTDTELIEIIEKAREMEEHYGHYFDQIIMNYDLDRAYQELISEINKLEMEPQWVPAHWVT